MPAAPTPSSATPAQDVLYGQDGDDTIRAGADDDDVYGELGADILYGEDGEDAILGDRGGVQNRYENGSTVDHDHADHASGRHQDLAPRRLGEPRGRPAARRQRHRPRRGRAQRARCRSTGSPSVASTGSAAAPGTTRSTAGAGDDLVNGDSGGDAVFGGRGNDVMWGGAGQVCAHTDTACLADRGVGG